MSTQPASTTCTVRQAVLADLDALLPLLDKYRQFYGQPGDTAAALAFLRARFDHGESILFLAHEGGAMLGFVQMYPSYSTIALARTFIFEDLYVCEAGRRRGVGKMLIEAASRHARTLGAVSLTLTTAHDNAGAQALYRSTGWIPEQTYVAYNLVLDAQDRGQA